MLRLAWQHDACFIIRFLARRAPELASLRQAGALFTERIVDARRGTKGELKSKSKRRASSLQPSPRLSEAFRFAGGGARFYERASVVCPPAVSKV